MQFIGVYGDFHPFGASLKWPPHELQFLVLTVEGTFILFGLFLFGCMCTSYVQLAKRMLFLLKLAGICLYPVLAMVP